MPDSSKNAPAPPRPAGGSPVTGPSRQAMLFLSLMLLGMWFWKSKSEQSAEPPVAYSQLYKWIGEGKVASVVFDGEVVDATLKSPEALGERQVTTLKTNIVANDPALLPLLHGKGVQITVKSQT